MNRRLGIGWIAVALMLFAVSTAGRCEDRETVPDQPAVSRIDWNHGWVQATGVYAPTTPSAASPGDRLKAVTAAKQSAQANLLAVSKSLRVHACHTIENVYGNDPVIMGKLESMVRQAPVIKQAYLSDGTVAVTLEMKIRGAFSQLVLPAEIRQIESIRTVAADKGTDARAAAGGVGTAAGAGAGVYSGLVVDARGLELNATMSPKIYDESGLEIYGSAFVSREFAVQLGMARYVLDMEAAVGLPRVGDHPLVVKGLRTTQPGHCDIVISNADASKIRSGSEHLIFLKQCQVVIVTDPQTPVAQ